MNVQEKILNDYHSLYPKESLRDIAKKTGIQLSRLFRIHNAKPMRVQEMEVFQRLIKDYYQKDKVRFQFTQLQEEALLHLKKEDLQWINEWLERKIYHQKTFIQNKQLTSKSALA